MKHLLVITFVLTILLSACAQGMNASQGTPVLTEPPASESPATLPPTTVSATPELAGTHLPVDIPPAQRLVMQDLANQLEISVDEIQMVSIEAVDWPDACLGVALMGIACAEVVTPGYTFVLEAQGRKYEYHTDQAGSVIRPATLGLTWHREGGIAGFCDDLSVFLPAAAYASSCKPDGKSAEGNLNQILSNDQLEQLNTWLTTFGNVTVTQEDPATADAMKTTLTLFGTGSAQPTETDQQAMLQWAQSVYGQIKQ